LVDTVVSGVDSVLGTDLAGSRVGTITTTCAPCDGTGERVERRPRRIDELSNDQLTFLFNADLEEVKLTNPFIGDEDDQNEDLGPEGGPSSGQPHRDPVPGGPREVPSDHVPAPGGYEPRDL